MRNVGLLMCAMLFSCMCKGQKFFIHTAEGATISGSTTFITQQDVNSSPDMILLVSPMYSASNTSEVGVTYDTKSKRWGIVNLDQKFMKSGALFNVLALKPADVKQAFVHVSGVDNVSGDKTVLEYPGLNDTPSKMVFVTPVASKNQGALSVGYHAGKWYVRNENLAVMESGVKINVLALDPGVQKIGQLLLTTFSHQVTSENVIDFTSFINHPSNSEKNLALLYTAWSWSENKPPASTVLTFAKGKDGAYKWGIANQDKASMEQFLFRNFNVLRIQPALEQLLVPVAANKGITFYELQEIPPATHQMLKDTKLHVILMCEQQDVEVMCTLFNTRETVWQSTVMPSYGFNFYEANLKDLPSDFYTLEAHFPDGKNKTIRFRLNQ